MPLYRYAVLGARGAEQRGLAMATDAAALEAWLEERNLELLRCRPTRPRWARSNYRPPRAELAALCFQLEQGLRAGVPVTELLEGDAEGGPTAGVCAVLGAVVAGGNTLSEGMRTLPGYFDAVFVSMVEAGERSGELPTVLAALGAHQQRMEEEGGRLRRALIYPAMVLLVAAVLIFVLFGWLLPQLPPLLLSLGVEPPWHLRFLLWLADGLRLAWPLLLLLALAPVPLFLWPGARRFRDALLLRLPLVGGLLRTHLQGRLAFLLHLCYGAGLDLVESLELAARAMNNRRLLEALQQARAQVLGGATFSDALTACALLPVVALRMLRTGEQSGSLEQALAHVKELLRRENDAAVQRFQALLEPSLLLFLGVLIGWLAISVLGPIYSVALGAGLR